MLYLSLLVLLPFVEIVGFIVIGGAIGLAWSLLWLLTAGVAGAVLLSNIGTEKPKKRKKPIDESDFGALEKVFDDICTLLAALLLIFPGFISDILALCLLVPVWRHMIFGALVRSHKHVLHDLGKSTEDFSMWYRGRQDQTPMIEGEWKSTPDQDK